VIPSLYTHGPYLSALAVVLPIIRRYTNHQITYLLTRLLTYLLTYFEFCPLQNLSWHKWYYSGLSKRSTGRVFEGHEGVRVGMRHLGVRTGRGSSSESCDILA